MVDTEEKTDTNISRPTSSDPQDSSETEKSDDSDDKTSQDIKIKSLDKKKIIRIVIGVLGLFILVSDFIFPEKKTNSEDSISSKPSQNEKIEKKTKSDESPKVDTTSVETPEPEKISEQATESVPEKSDVNESPIPSEEANLETSELPKNDVVEVPETPELGPGKTDTTDSFSDTSDKVIDSSEKETKKEQGSGEDFTEEILLDLEKQAKEAKKIETIKEYVAPPNYEYVGRGLVYNCTGKHWACVDAPSFKSCEENQSSVKYLKKKIECHPFNVYDSIKNCENMQNRLVSSSAKTNFCNE